MRVDGSLNAKKQQVDQTKAFKENLEILTRKLKDVGSRIEYAHREFVEVARQSMMSMIKSRATVNDNDSGSFTQESLLVDQKFRASDEDLKMQQDTEFMQETLNQRNQDINQIGEIMANLNEMARDLAIETKAQGEKLLKLHENVEVAEQNVEEAHEQLKQAATHQRRAGKCTRCLVILIFLLLISVALIIYFNFIK